MFVSLAMLFLIVLASTSVGCCIGMIVMALCRISAENNYSEEETP